MNISFLLSDAPGLTASFMRVGNDMEKIGFRVYYFSDSETVAAKYRILGGAEEKLICFARHNRYHSPQIESDNNINRGNFADLERLRLYYDASPQHIDEFFKKADTLYNFFKTAIINLRLKSIISESVAGGYTFAAFLAAKSHDITFIGYEISRINGLTEIYFNGETKDLVFSDDGMDIIKSCVNEYLEKSLTGAHQIPIYMEKNSLINVSNASIYERVASKDRMSQLLHNLVCSLLNYRNYFGFRPISKDLVHLKFLLRRKLSLIRAKFRSAKLVTPPVSKINLVFPLHFHPEGATSMRSQEHFNELDILTYLCSMLPENYTVYIKEHPSMLGRRSRSSQLDYKALPRSIYMDTKDKFHNDENIDFVVTLTGTMGLEYALRGKRVITFGDVFYNSHPNVTNVQSKDECMKELMREARTDSMDLNEDSNFLWLLKYAQKCLPGTFELSSCTEQELADFTRNLALVLRNKTL